MTSGRSATRGDDWSNRYLALLGIERRRPSRAALDEIVRAHRGIAFENLSSLMRRHRTGDGPVPPLDLDALLEDWSAGRGGGVCYEFGSMLERLLANLGYRVDPILARISFPGSHSALLTELDGERLIVDAGNGQPIFETIEVGPTFEIDRAGLRYRFRLDEPAGTMVQDRWVDGGFAPFVHYQLTAATPAEMEASYQRHHALPARTFVMENFRVVRCTEDVVLQLRDHTYTRYTSGGRTTEQVTDPERYRELLHGSLGLPGVDVDAALAAWEWVSGSASSPA